jgi:hypothetical protein
MEVLESYKIIGYVVHKIARYTSDGSYFEYKVQFDDFPGKYPMFLTSRYMTMDVDHDLNVSPPTGVIAETREKWYDGDPEVIVADEDGTSYPYEFTLERGSLKKVGGKEKSGEYPSDYFWNIKGMKVATEEDVAVAQQASEKQKSDMQEGLEYGNAMNIAGPIILELLKSDRLDMLDDPRMVANIARKQVALAQEFVRLRELEAARQNKSREGSEGTVLT